MSNDLTVIPDFLAPEQAKEELEAQKKLLTNPALLYPRIRMNKDTRGFVADLNDQNVFTEDTLYFVILGHENFYGSRALFEPGDNSTSPVCATPLLSPGQHWMGKWSNEDIPCPQELDRNYCRSCRWSNFGSEPEWDASKGSSNGQACKERRIIFGCLVQPTMANARFELVDDRPMRLVLPATSIKGAEGMVVAATAAGVVLSGAVFRLQVKIKESGSFKWPVLESKLTGFLSSQNDFTRINDIRREVHAVVSTDMVYDESYNESSAGNTNTEDDRNNYHSEPGRGDVPGDDEIPF